MRADDAARQPGHGGGEQHAPEAALHHPGEDPLGEQERRPQVDGEHAVERRGIDVLPAARRAEAMIGHQHVHRPELGLDAVDQRGRRGRVPEIALHQQRPCPRRLHGAGIGGWRLKCSPTAATPASASRRLSAAPMPPLAPVTSATLPVRTIGHTLVRRPSVRGIGAGDAPRRSHLRARARGLWRPRSRSRDGPAGALLVPAPVVPDGATWPRAAPGVSGRAGSLLKDAGLPDDGTDVVAETRRGRIVAAFIRVRRDPDAVKRRYDARKAPGKALESEPLAHVRRIDWPNGTLEYGRKGCALLVGIGRFEAVDAGFVVMYSDG